MTTNSEVGAERLRRAEFSWAFRPMGAIRRFLPHAGVALIMLFCLAPFYWMIVSALRPPGAQFETTIFQRRIVAGLTAGGVK